MRDQQRRLSLGELPPPPPQSFVGRSRELLAQERLLFDLCQSLLQADPATRLLFTSREPLPTPFDHRRCEIELGRLSRADAVELVSRVLAERGLTPAETDPGQTPQEISDLVEAVNGHARALILLAPDIAGRGVQATTANLSRLMADLETKHPGDRQNSLYASLELSLHRLLPEMREPVKVLGVFHGGANLRVWDYVLNIPQDDETTIPRLASALIDVGLAQDMGYLHLRLDPALPAYLWAQLTPAQQEQLQTHWAEGMRQLAGFLYQQQFQDAQLAAQLTLLELPNLLVLLEWALSRLSPEQVVGLATSVEQLLAYLGQPQALVRAVAVRKQAAQTLGEWSGALFNAEVQKIERLLASGNLQAAYTTAQQLLQQCLTAGEAAYPGAAYDIAVAHILLGRVLQSGGQAEAALTPLAEARRRFETLAGAGNTGAARMASGAITESADCLRALGRLDEAAVAYEEAIERFEKLDDKRSVAGGNFQLGTVRMLQNRYAEALDIYVEARQMFERLGEPDSVATAWHQIGMVHRRAGQFDQAERAYRQGLAIRVQQKLRADEAGNLTELGLLYKDMGRLEEAVGFYRQATDIDLELQDLFNEGKDRAYIAKTLLKLHRYDEARRELLRTIECFKPFGHAAEPWKAWDILYRLEQATSNLPAAAQARQQAVGTYLAYRRAGGESHRRGTAHICALIVQAIREGQEAVAAAALPDLLAQANVSEATGAKLQAILAGERNPAIAEDDNLDYQDATELRLLLEAVAG